MRRCCPQSCDTGVFNEEDCLAYKGLGTCTYPNDAQCQTNVQGKKSTNFVFSFEILFMLFELSFSFDTFRRNTFVAFFSFRCTNNNHNSK